MFAVADALDEAERVDYLAALDDSTVPAAAIVLVMRRRGLQLSATGVRNYRRGLYGTY